MTTKTKKRKQKWRWLRYRKGDHAHNLICAAQHWIHEHGGCAVVIGGIGILDEENPFLEATKGKFQVCIGALGTKPTKFKEKKDAKK